MINFVARHGILYGGMFSLCGRNAMFCANKYCFHTNDIMQCHLNNNIVKEYYAEMISAEDINTVMFLMELTFVRDGIFSLDGFVRQDIDDLILLVCSI